MIDELARRLLLLERGDGRAAVDGASTPPLGGDVMSPHDPGDADGGEATSRRHLLARAATAAAGAVAGGTALALSQASPAAARRDRSPERRR
ncbi:MAG: hypothetical protein R2726_02120 [Acidimicrobiales bacterium]